MLQHKKFALRLVTFLMILGVALGSVNGLLAPKYYYNSDWPTSSTYLDFYHMERNTVDVLFLGSSHCAAAFSPIDLYEEFGIRSYNLGCEQQNLLVSYYWLKEALRRQKPQYVFLDTFMLFPYNESEPLNTAVEATEKALDFMHRSYVRLQAVRDVCGLDASQRLAYYIFPNERYHTRWKQLNENDFTLREMAAHETLMGFRPIEFMCSSDAYQPYEDGGTVEYADMVPVMRAYLDRIVALCDERGIQLVLVKTPTMFYSKNAYSAVSLYAAERGLDYLDFNEAGLYGAAGLDFSVDSCDTDHVSVSGAEKVNRYIGSWLMERGMTGRQDYQWEGRAGYYAHYRNDRQLKQISDAGQYLSALDENEYCLLLSALGDVTEIVTAVGEELRGLGLHPEMVQLQTGGYYAVRDGGTVLSENYGEGVLKEEGTIRNGIQEYSVMSSADAATISVGGGNLVSGEAGLYLVVYCKEQKRVIDSVCIRFNEGRIECLH